MFILSGCATPAIVTTSKADTLPSSGYKRIMVAVILPAKDSVLRKQLESSITKELDGLDFITLSITDEFGASGFNAAGEEAGYVKRCSAEIDAVFTLSMLPGETGFYDNREALKEPNLYYYRRIWTYRKMQESERGQLSSYYWESILFDLATLQARCVIRTGMQENN